MDDNFNKPTALPQTQGAESLPFEDRRMFLRFPVTLPVKFVCRDSDVSGKGSLRDISANGMGVSTKKRLNVYARLEISIDCSTDEKPFYTTGEVVWVERVDFDSYRAGIRLDKPELMGVWRVLNTRNQSAAEAAGKTRKKEIFFSAVLRVFTRLCHWQ
jgi:hypothetical protein